MPEVIDEPRPWHSRPHTLPLFQKSAESQQNSASDADPLRLPSLLWIKNLTWKASIPNPHCYIRPGEANFPPREVLCGNLFLMWLSVEPRWRFRATEKSLPSVRPSYKAASHIANPIASIRTSWAPSLLCECWSIQGALVSEGHLRCSQPSLFPFLRHFHGPLQRISLQDATVGLVQSEFACHIYLLR